MEDERIDCKWEGIPMKALKRTLVLLSILALLLPAAAMAIEGTRSAWPVAWLGSTTTGRCVSLRSTGTAERSSVLRV